MQDTINKTVLIDNIPVAIFRIDFFGNLLSFNNYFCELLNLNLIEGNTYNVIDLGILNLNIIKEIIIKFKETKIINNYYSYLKKSDGNLIFVSLLGRLIETLDSQFIDIAIIILEDKSQIREKKYQIENEYDKLSEQYKNFLDNIPIGMHFYSLENDKLIFIGYNKEANRILGIDNSQFLNKDIEDAFPQVKNTVIPSKYKYVAITGEKWEHDRYFYKDNLIEGAYKIFAFKYAHNKMVVAFYDITENVKLEQKLKFSEHRKRLILENIPLGLLIYNKGKIIYFNKSLLNLLHCSEHEQLEKLNFIDIIHPFDREEVLNYILKLYSTPYNNEQNDISSFETRIKTFDNKEKICEIKAISYLEQEEIYLLLLLEDITIRKHQQTELIKAKLKAEESDKLKTAFISNISHELRTPMNGIIGFSKLITDNSVSNEEKRIFSNALIESTNRLLNTIEEVLLISEIQNNQIELFITKFSILELIKDLYEYYLACAKRKYLNFVLELPEHLTIDYYVENDLEKVKIIIKHLLDNAFKFTFNGFVKLRLEIKDKNVFIQISDSGIGISEEFLSKIYNIFAQENISLSRPYEGIGLGLPIVKGLLNLMNGEINVSSEVNKGTTVTVVLPIKLRKEVFVKRRLSLNELKNERFLYNSKVLIVEDDHVNLMFLKRILEANFQTKILYAENGEDALEIFKNNQDIEIILMDLKIPKLTGVEVTKEILKINPNIPIIAVTAYSNSEIKNLAYDIGCKYVVVKPYEQEHLFNVMYNILKRNKN